jgi:hypothetical protein
MYCRYVSVFGRSKLLGDKRVQEYTLMGYVALALAEQ